MKSLLWLFLISAFGAANAVTIDFEDVPVSPSQFKIPSYSTYGFILSNDIFRVDTSRPDDLTILNDSKNAYLWGPGIFGGITTLSRTKYTSADNGLFDLCSIEVDGYNGEDPGSTSYFIQFSGYRAGQKVIERGVTLKIPAQVASQPFTRPVSFQPIYFSDFTNLDKVSWSAISPTSDHISDNITAIPRNGKHQCPKVPVCNPKPLDMTRVNPEIGYAYIIYASFGGPADISLTENRSTLRLFENGVPLPAHIPHADIRTYGKGRFSHWSLSNGSSEALRFSSTDNSNPKTNGRQYTWCIAQQ